MMEFTECVQYMPLGISQHGKMANRTHDGVYLGVNITTGESYIGTTDGIFNTRSIHRKPLAERWNAAEILGIKGTPMETVHAHRG